jgi:hypothetical protein
MRFSTAFSKAGLQHELRCERLYVSVADSEIVADAELD